MTGVNTGGLLPVGVETGNPVWSSFCENWRLRNEEAEQGLRTLSLLGNGLDEISCGWIQSRRIKNHTQNRDGPEDQVSLVGLGWSHQSSSEKKTLVMFVGSCPAASFSNWFRSGSGFCLLRLHAAQN